MKLRIRYDFDGPIGISRASYSTANNGSVRLVIDKEKGHFEIVDHNGTAIVSKPGSKNYITLLRQTKRALERLGVQFGQEERNRDYGVRPKQEG